MHRFDALAEHPFELLFGALACAAGLALTLGVVPPTSLNATLPAPVVSAWAGTQVLGGGLIVAGIIIRYTRPALLLLGLRLERAGLWPLSAACAVYAMVALGYAGTRSLYPVSVLFAVAAACVARARAVAGVEKTIRRLGGEGQVGR